MLRRLTMCLLALVTLLTTGCRDEAVREPEPVTSATTQASTTQSMSYHCKTCGELHTELPHIGDDRPAYYYGVPEAERERRVKLTGDTCVIDDKDYFIRGVIEIPVHGHPDEFGWGVWVSLKKENFEKYQANFDTPEIGPFFGWLSTEIDWYKPQSTINLKTMAHFRGNGLRPMIKLEPSSDHPLAIDHRNGITLDKAWEIVHHYSKD